MSEPIHSRCSDADDLLATKQINDWEHRSLGLVAYREELTEKQQDVYDRIASKIDRVACGAAGEKWWR